MVVVAAAPHRTAESQRGQVGALIVAVRPRLPERRDRSHDQGRRLFCNVLVAYSRRVQVARWVAVNHHVGLDRQPLEYLASPVLLQVESHAALAGVVVPEEQAPVRSGLVIVERLVASRGVARRRLDLDDVGPNVAHKLPAPGSDLTAHLQHADSVENSLFRMNLHVRRPLLRSAHRPSSARFPALPRRPPGCADRAWDRLALSGPASPTA